MTDLERAREALYRRTKVGDIVLSMEERVVEALAAARREGAEEMRERAAREAEGVGIEARDTEWDEGVNYAKRYVAECIRALPLTPEEPT